MPSLPQRKLSQDPIFANLKDGDRLPVLRTPQDEADPARRNGTASLASLAAALAKYLPAGSSFIATDIPDANADRDAGNLQKGSFYTIDGDWNADGNDKRVYLQSLEKSAFASVGVLRDAQGAFSFVTVDVATGTTTPAGVDAYTKAESNQQHAELEDYIDAMRADLGHQIGQKASKQDVADLIGAAPAALDTLAELAAQLLADEAGAAAMLAAINQHTASLMEKASYDDLPLSFLYYNNVTSAHTAGNPAQPTTGTLWRVNPFAASTTDFYVALPPAWRNQSAYGVTLAFNAFTDCTLHLTAGLVDHANSISLTAGETVVVSATSEGRSTRAPIADTSGENYTVVLRTGTGAPAAGTVKSVQQVGPDAAGNVTLPTRNLYDVDAQKRLDVASANTAKVSESDSNYYYKKFYDSTTYAPQTYFYDCGPVAEGNTTYWYWFRRKVE